MHILTLIASLYTILLLPHSILSYLISSQSVHPNQLLCSYTNIIEQRGADGAGRKVKGQRRQQRHSLPIHIQATIVLVLITVKVLNRSNWLKEKSRPSQVALSSPLLS